MAWIFNDCLPIKNGKNLDADVVAGIIRDLPGTDLDSELIAEARNPWHPLHKSFDWDDASAAHKHRLSTARTIIAAVLFVGHDAKPVRAFTSIEVNGERRYYTPTEIMCSDTLQSRMMRQADKDLRAWLARYRRLKSIAVEPLLAPILERLGEELFKQAERDIMG